MVNRSASKPTAELARKGTIGALSALAAAWVLEETGNANLAALAGALITGGAAWLGKVIRDYAAERGVKAHLTP